MNNILLITKREFLTQVKKKSFVVLTLAAPLMIIAFGVLISYLIKANKSSFNVNVVDKSGYFQGRMNSQDGLKYIYIPAANEVAIRNSLKDMKGAEGLLLIPAEKDFRIIQQKSKLLTNTNIGYETKEKIARDMLKVIRGEKIRALGLDEEQITNLDQSFSLYTQNVVDNNKADDDMAFGVKSGLSVVLMYATFMFIIIYGVRVMRSVLEEKNNRVVEIIISSVKPFELMLGKILGVTMVALTQFVVWILMSVVSAAFLNTGFSAMGGGIPGAASGAEKLNIMAIAVKISHILLSLDFPIIIFVFIFYFLFGYLFYSSIYAAVGSAVDNETETQQFTIFAVIPLMLGMYGSFGIMDNPDGPMGFWLSIIPFTSPVAMIARIPFGVPAWQIILSMILLAISTLLMVYIAGKIYRIGILMYGNKATAKEIWKWIRS